MFYKDYNYELGENRKNEVVLYNDDSKMRLSYNEADNAVTFCFGDTGYGDTFELNVRTAVKLMEYIHINMLYDEPDSISYPRKLKTAYLSHLANVWNSRHDWEVKMSQSFFEASRLWCESNGKECDFEQYSSIGDKAASLFMNDLLKSIRNPEVSNAG